MNKINFLPLLLGFIFTTGCHAHRADKVVVIKDRPNHKVILVDNEHRRNNYRIVHVKPGPNKICKKHHRHWHCL